MRTEPESSEYAGDGFRELLAFLRRRMWFILASLALGLGAAGAVSIVQDPAYVSTAEVLVKPVTPSPLRDAPNIETVDLETEREIARSTPVAEAAREALESEAPVEDLLSRVAVSVVPESQILQIRFSASKPAEAQAGAQSFADSYLAYRTGQAVTAYEQVRDEIESQIEDLEDDLGELDDELGGLTDEGEEAELRAVEGDRDLVVSQIAVLKAELVPLSLLDVDAGSILQAAGLPADPASPNLPLNLGLGLFAGLAVGMAGALLRERLETPLRGREELEHRTGAPVLGLIPRRAKRTRGDSSALAMLADPRSGEAYRVLRMSLLHAAEHGDAKTILVTSPSQQGVQRKVAANLAAALAESQRDVILVSADLRNPGLDKLLGMEDGAGLVELVEGRATTRTALRSSSVDRLRVLLGGEVLTSPNEVLGSEKTAALLKRLRTAADFVLIECPPVLPFADALLLAPLVDGVLLVVDANTTNGPAVTETREALEGVGASILGSALVGPGRFKGRRTRAQRDGSAADGSTPAPRPTPARALTPSASTRRRPPQAQTPQRKGRRPAR